MDVMENCTEDPLPPLPPMLMEASQGRGRMRKRQRTRAQLIAAAARVYSRRGIAGATIREIATVAEMSPVTFYNHFRSERELVHAVGTWVADTFCTHIVASYAGVSSGAERLSIGCRRFLWLAQYSPPWALFVADVAAATTAFTEQIGPYVLADLQLGRKQGDFRAGGNAAALDLVSGTILQSMRRIAIGEAPRNHAKETMMAVLCGLGLSSAKARKLLLRPLPDMVHAGN